SYESAKKPTLNSPQNDADNEQPAPRSLLADFAAGDIRATVPLGPASNTGDDPFAVSPTLNAPAAKGPTTPEASGPQKLVTSAKGGRRSKTTLEQCDAAFKLIDKMLDDLAMTVNKSTSTVKKWYLESSKDLRTGVNVWNLFQAYWARHKEEELTSFQALYGERTEAFLKTALQYDRAIAEPQTIQQRSRAFNKLRQKLERVVNEASEDRFQTLVILVGDCVQEDQGLGAIVSSFGLSNLSNSLQIDDETLLGLAKCSA
ncbi:hypothetical protein H0H92_009594, partial [Tricholoma furcatifolium]